MENLTVKIKSKTIKNQMEELTKLSDNEMIDQYRNFRRIFEDDVRLLANSLPNNLESNNFVNTIKVFIINEINKIDKISDNLVQNHKYNIDNTLDTENGMISVNINNSKKYKYCQQIINDYLIMMEYFKLNNEVSHLNIPSRLTCE